MKAWAVIDDDGIILLYTIRKTQDKSKAGFSKDIKNKGWSFWERIGYTCKRIKITKDGENGRDNTHSKKLEAYRQIPLS